MSDEYSQPAASASSGGGGGGGPQYPNPLQTLSEAAAKSFDHAANMGQKVAAGTYTVGDGKADLAQCVVEMAETAQKVLGWWAAVLTTSPTPRATGSQMAARMATPDFWSATMNLTTDQRPLKLQTTGFRHVGFGPGPVIQPDKVWFMPPTIADPSVTSFTIEVDMRGQDPGIYEGTVVSAQYLQTPVTDVVMPTC